MPKRLRRKERNRLNVNKWMGEWVSEWVSLLFHGEIVDNFASLCAFFVSLCAIKKCYYTESHRGNTMSEWVSEWMSEWMNEWMNELRINFPLRHYKWLLASFLFLLIYSFKLRGICNPDNFPFIILPTSPLQMAPCLLLFFKLNIQLAVFSILYFHSLSYWVIELLGCWMTEWLNWGFLFHDAFTNDSLPPSFLSSANSFNLPFSSLSVGDHYNSHDRHYKTY